MKNPLNLIIVGGGAGGLELVISLAKKLKKNKLITLTLVDKSPIHLWKPLLHEAAAGTLNSFSDELSYYSLAKNNHFQFLLGTMEGLDREKKEILLSPILDNKQEVIVPKRSLHYDILIIAVGSVSNDFNIPGVKENCFFLDNTEQALGFHQYLIKKLMRLSYHPAEKLDIAVIGGGATGVELTAELHYAVREMAQYGMHFDPSLVSFTLIEASERLLPALSPHLSTLVLEQLNKLDVNVQLKEQVSEITAEKVITKSEKAFTAQIKVWAAGIKGPEFLQKLDGLETNNNNQLIVKPTLQTTFDSAIFAFGDCASYYDEATAKIIPPRAQVSHQQAQFLAKLIPLFINQKPLPAYHYRDYGSLISLSYYETVGNLMGRITKSLMIEGKLARFAYLSLYRLHQRALYGSWKVMVLLLANLITQKIRSRLKLH